MVLAYWGHTVSEADMVKVLGTKVFGTPISHIKRLKKLGYRVDFGSLTLEQLKLSLNQGVPVIVQLWTTMLSYWNWISDSSHVVVVIGFDETYIYLNDPAFYNAPQQVLWDSFLAAWAEFDETSAIITPITQN
ncbi:C39 family peptidase [Anaerolineales bacterium HSG6]|nr:C39 family peptidase [Anaerolineales bacterium HSG6]